MIIAIAVTIAFNANTIKVAEVLWNDDASRAAIVKLAEDAVDGDGLDPTGAGGETDGQKETGNAIVQGTRANEIIRQTSRLPLGWEGENPFNWEETNAITKQSIPGWDCRDWVSHILGWTITAFALSLGAPFWFDALKKLINLRTSGSPPRTEFQKAASLRHTLIAQSGRHRNSGRAMCPDRSSRV